MGKRESARTRARFSFDEDVLRDMENYERLTFVDIDLLEALIQALRAQQWLSATTLHRSPDVERIAIAARERAIDLLEESET